MPADTVNAEAVLNSTTNVTVSNAATFTNTTSIVQHCNGLIEFTDREGNVIKSRDKTLLKLIRRIEKEQSTSDVVFTAPSVSNP